MIFVDTTVWVGASDRNDDFHESSRQIAEAILFGKMPIALTTDFVIDETVTILGKRKGFGAENARKVGEAILSSPRILTAFVEETILKRALEHYPRRQGQLSLTDIVSVVVMQKYNVKEIFSHDSDFNGIEGIIRRDSLYSRELPTI